MFQRLSTIVLCQRWSEMKIRLFLASMIVVMSCVAGAGDYKHEYVIAVTSVFGGKDIQRWFKSEDWCVAAIFWDLNGDGKMDALIATPDEQADRKFNWIPTYAGVNGYDRRDYGLEDNAILGCDGRCIYSVMKNAKAALLFREACVDRYKEGTRLSFEEGDVVAVMGEHGKLRYTFVTNYMEQSVMEPDFIRLERALPEYYIGFVPHRCVTDFEPGGKYGPKGSLEPLGGIGKPDGVESFLEGMAKGVANSTTNRYRAVFADVDNDGDADFYLASDGDKRGAGMWHWRLYLNEKGAFVPAKEPIRIGKGSSASVMIDCEVDAGTNDFYRVVRKDILPTVEVFLSDGDRLHSRSFYRLTTPMERKQKGGESFGDWSMGYASAHDCPGPLDFDDLVSWPWFHSLERLPCETFAVPREMTSDYDVYGEEYSNRISTTHNEF